MKKLILASSFLATVPAANWLIGNVGTVCVPHGPCLIPVAPGIMAPSGVLMIGAALVLRNLLNLTAGRAWIAGAIAGGVALSAVVAPPSLVIASAVAFGLSELADWTVYTPLARRNLSAAVLAAGIVGSVVDSAVFLSIAFGTLDFMVGQVIGKGWATLAVLPLLPAFRRALAPEPQSTINTKGTDQ